MEEREGGSVPEGWGDEGIEGVRVRGRELGSKEGREGGRKRESQRERVIEASLSRVGEPKEGSERTGTEGPRELWNMGARALPAESQEG